MTDFSDDDSWMLEAFTMEGRAIERSGPFEATRMIDVVTYWLKEAEGIGGITIYRTPRNRT